ncbi:hypothetical protein QTP86_024449 [Hemibagrus guttatus]|nr:hypothetical protein QTP86_024449 [Hemibagrus guttatus]
MSLNHFNADMIISIFSLFAVIQLTTSITVDIPQQKYELARGDTAVLPCTFKPQKPDNPTITISWSANPDNPEDSDIDILSYYYAANSPPVLDITDDFINRASLEVDIPKGSAILSLKSLTSKDSRVFQCTVKIPGDKQGKTSDTASVVVLVAPSKPICNVQGKAEFYQNINLTCRSEEGTPPPTYKWESYDVTNKPRPNPPKSTDVNGVLSLYNISADTSGYYICTSANKIRSDSCNLTLSVMPCKYFKHSMNLGSTAGIIGGCVAGLVLLIVVICCCRRCRKKKESEEHPMEFAVEDRYTDEEPRTLVEQQDRPLESKADEHDDRGERGDRYDDPRDDDRQRRPDNRQYGSDRYDDRRSDYDDRRSDRYDRQSDYDDRRSDRYDDRRDRYDHPDDRYEDRRNRYDHPDDRYDDRRDRYDQPGDRSRPPNVPHKKPTPLPWCEAVQVSVRDERRFAMLFQSVVLPCQYTSTSTHTPVVQWWFKSYCRDRTRDAFSFPDSLGVRGSELGPTSHLDCSDNSRTVRVVASGQGSSLTIADYYKDRDISIINKADLRIGELRWGDSGVYYCKVVIADDLEGQNEAHVELLVLGQTGVADDLLPEIDLEIMPEWVFVVVVVLGGVLFFVLAGVCWCQCCPHSCCCYVRCCCCPETCCCPRHLYEAGKGIKTASPTPVAIYPPYYMQGMPAMVPISPPSLVESKMSTVPSTDNNISSSQQPLVHSGYRIQPTPDQNSLKVLQYVERELAHFNPSKTLSSHDSKPCVLLGTCSMSELSSLHEAETDFHQAYRKVQKKALPAIPDMDDPPDLLSREKSPVHAPTSARLPHLRVKDDHPRWNPRSEHLQRKAFQMGGRTGSLDELEEFAMGYVQRRRHDDFSDDEDDHMTCAKERQCEQERERRRQRDLERDHYPYYSSKRYSPKDIRDRPRPPSPPKRRGTGDSNLRRDLNEWDLRRQEVKNGRDYDDDLLNSLWERKAKAGRSLSSKGGRNEEESDRPSKNSSQKSCHSHSPSNRSASNKPTEDESLPPYAEREPERFRGAVNSHQPLTSTRSRKEQENKEELSRPRKVVSYM